MQIASGATLTESLGGMGRRAMPIIIMSCVKCVETLALGDLVGGRMDQTFRSKSESDP